MTAKLAVLHESNFRDPVATLRKIADGIEAGEYGDVSNIALVVLGDRCEVFGAGRDSDAPACALLLHAGFQRLSGAVAGHGRTEGS